MKRFSFFFEPDMMRMLKREAKMKGYASLSAFVRKILHNYLSGDQKL